MKTMETDYVSPGAEVVELILEGSVMTGSQIVGGGTQGDGFDGEE